VAGIATFGLTTWICICCCKACQRNRIKRQTNAAQYLNPEPYIAISSEQYQPPQFNEVVFTGYPNQQSNNASYPTYQPEIYTQKYYMNTVVYD